MKVYKCLDYAAILFMLHEKVQNKHKQKRIYLWVLRFLFYKLKFTNAMSEIIFQSYKYILIKNNIKVIQFGTIENCVLSYYTKSHNGSIISGT